MPRAEQRARTRQRIVDAIARLVDGNSPNPTVDDIVAEADCSRATFYRYFTSPSEGIFQALADRRLPAVDDVVAPGRDVDERIRRAEEAVNGFLFDDADRTRAFEKAMLERTLSGTATPLDRPARRLRFIDAALEPVADSLTPDELFLLRHALALTMGSSVVPALMDTCGLDAADARRVTEFAARTLAGHAAAVAAARRDQRAVPRVAREAAG